MYIYLINSGIISYIIVLLYKTFDMFHGGYHGDSDISLRDSLQLLDY